MRLPILTCVLIGLLGCGLAAATDALRSTAPMESLRFDSPIEQMVLRGRDARLQLVVSHHSSNGLVEDATHRVVYQSQPEGVVQISEDGLVSPLADGKVTITVESRPELIAQVRIEVVDTGNEPPVNFAGRIVPIFTKLHCNGGGCHGKAAGQNGFKLSLLGFEPREDYEHLIRESRGRRIFPAAPEQSLLLTKATGQSPHGGGARLQADSHEYRILRRWIAQGMPYGETDQTQIEAIEVIPRQRRLLPTASQQLSVVAIYSDGTREDVTRGAVYESNDSEMADVSVSGLVTIGETVGDVAVMARYQGRVAVFSADVPVPSVASAVNDDPHFTPEPNNVVDQFVFEKLRSLGVPPSRLCDDATFLRRVTLDIVGRLPTLEEIERFEADPSPNKRAALVERLLDSPDHADYFAGKWNAILRNRRQGDQLQFATVAFHEWIRRKIAINQPYDEFVRDILTASGTVASNPPVAWYHQVADTNSRAEDAAQLFLGQRIQCARCHHHPYEKWSQQDYAQFAAFFTTVGRKVDADPIEPALVARRAAALSPHPKTGQPLSPAGLDGTDLQIAAEEDPRLHLAQWMTDPENPFFARALVNRYWKHFLGRGLVEPEDDLRVTNPPSNPELLDGLSAAFVASGYDLKQLIRLIVLSKTYALDSDATDQNLGDRRSHSRFYPKRLQAEVLLDAIDQVTRVPTPFDGMPLGTRAVALPDTAFDSYFLNVFGRPESSTACECERSQQANLAQSLHLLNSEQMQKKLSSEQGRAAALAANAVGDDQSNVRQLYRLTMTREPSESELQAAISYLKSKQDRREGYEDLIWSLLNSKEFLFNH